MQTAIEHLFETLLIAQAAPPAGVPTGVVVALGTLAAAAGALFAWAFLRLRSVRQRLAALTVEHRSTTGAHRALMDKERKQAKTLDGKRDDIKDLKRDLAAQKKKNHSLQEELKQVRADLRDQVEATQKARASRPAFAEPTVKTDKPADTAAAKQREKLPEKPAARPVSSDTPATDANAAEAIKLREELTREREAVKSLRGELHRLRRRVEDLRRVDLITKGQTAVLEDKVRNLGRQWYEAVSELAALKGEVAPLQPRNGVPPPLTRYDEDNGDIDTAAEELTGELDATAEELAGELDATAEELAGEPAHQGAGHSEDGPGAAELAHREGSRGVPDAPDAAAVADAGDVRSVPHQE